MLQQENPEDFVICTGESHSVRDFLELAFSHVNLSFEDYVTVDERFFRPAEVDLPVGDASLAKEKLGWAPSLPLSFGLEKTYQWIFEQVQLAHATCL